MIIFLSIVSMISLILVGIICIYFFIAFIVNNKNTVDIDRLVAVTGVALILIGLSYATNDLRISETQRQYYSQGKDDGYESGIAEARQSLEISEVGYDSICLTFPDGETDEYSYSWIPADPTEAETFGKVKTYEDYRNITSPTAPQTALNNLKTVYTDSQGLRKINDYYLVAMGSFYGKIGDIFQVTLSSGRIIMVIKGDSKGDQHTDSSHRYQTQDGSVIEFIVDSSVLKNYLGSRGDVSYLGFEGSITNIEPIGHYSF